jgi:hypothetical protein
LKTVGLLAMIEERDAANALRLFKSNADFAEHYSRLSNP